MNKPTDEKLPNAFERRLWNNVQAFSYRIPTTEVTRSITRLNRLEQRDSHALILYERSVMVQPADDGYLFEVKTLRRYGSDAHGGHPTISAKLEASVKQDGNVQGVAHWSHIALVRAIGISILASLILLVSIFIMEWSRRNLPLIVGWVIIVLAFPTYFWLELWWDVYALIRDVRRQLTQF